MVVVVVMGFAELDCGEMKHDFTTYFDEIADVKTQLLEFAICDNGSDCYSIRTFITSSLDFHSTNDDAIRAIGRSSNLEQMKVCLSVLSRIHAPKKK